MKQSYKLYTKQEGGNSRLNRDVLKNPRYRWERHRKQTLEDIENEVHSIPFKKRHYKFISNENYHNHTERNYIPLYHYLLSKVGENWANVWEDIFPRVDGDANAIQKLVLNINKNGIKQKDFDIANAKKLFNYNVFYYQTRYFSTLYVDDNNVLQFVAKNYRPKRYNSIWNGCYETLNGKKMY